MANELPRFRRMKQSFPRPLVSDVIGTVRRELAALQLDKKIRPGQKIGVTAGSRGIQNIVLILKIVTEYLRELGAEPRLLAAMGSHGGGTEAGQRELLESFGITEASIGVPVTACAVSRIVGQTQAGLPVYTLESALAVDSILVVNRVKTHTSFKGQVESGLVKKMVVGLGGPQGAKQFHNFGSEELPRLLVEIGQVLLDKLPVLGGLAIVENAYEETAQIEAIATKNIIARETELLVYSKSLMPTLPVSDLDLLLIGEMGKNYSGTGIDTNIIGRIRIEGVPEPASPSIKRVAILDLSEASHGNAHGMGLADFVTEKLVNKVDRAKTYLNSLTSTFVIRSAIPMYFPNEKELLSGALLSLGGIAPEKLRAALIPNTLYLTDLWVSEAVAAELDGKPGIEWCGGCEECRFDADGNLLLKV
ncbi:MAG: hypothetical protein ABFC57_05880 [Veillonellales bacterium]